MMKILIFLLLPLSLFSQKNDLYVEKDKQIITVFTTTSLLDSSFYIDVEWSSTNTDYSHIYRIWDFDNRKFNFILPAESWNKPGYLRVSASNKEHKKVHSNDIVLYEKQNLYFNFLTY